LRQLCGCARCAADQNAVAVEQRDLDGDIAAFHNMLRGPFRRACNFIAERNTFGLRQRKRLRCGIGRHDARAKPGRATGRLREESIDQTRLPDQGFEAGESFLPYAVRLRGAWRHERLVLRPSVGMSFGGDSPRPIPLLAEMAVLVT